MNRQVMSLLRGAGANGSRSLIVALRFRLPELEERLSRTRDELHQLAAQIVELDTWAAQRERTGLNKRWRSKDSLRRRPKSPRRARGVRDAEMMREARRLLAAARRAVPVWIMPLGRVYESFDPRETKFDVVIIDEASQSDVTALAALSLVVSTLSLATKNRLRRMPSGSGSIRCNG